MFHEKYSSIATHNIAIARSYPEIYWCSWCYRPNSILNDVPIANRHRRASINTSAEELDLQPNPERRIYPVAFNASQIDYFNSMNQGLPSYNEVFNNRIPSGLYNTVAPPNTYEDNMPPVYGIQTRSDAEDAEEANANPRD